MKKKLILFLFVIIIIGVFSSYNVGAKKKTKINYSKKSIFIGKTAKLKIKNTKKKVKWSSNNKNIAVVSKKGRVKALKIGKATITAKVGKKKYRCKITVYGYSIHDFDGYDFLPTNKPEKWRIVFRIKKKDIYCTPAGKCDVLYMNNSGKVVYTDAISFDATNYKLLSVGDGVIADTCEVEFDMGKRPKSLMGYGYFGCVVRLNNGQAFNYFKEWDFFMNNAQGGELIKYNNTQIKIPYYSKYSTFSGGSCVADTRINNIEYAFTDMSPGVYKLTFTIHGVKTWDINGLKEKRKCGFSYEVKDQSQNSVKMNYEFLYPTEYGLKFNGYSLDRKVGDEIVSMASSCVVKDNNYYEISLSDYYY